MLKLLERLFKKDDSVEINDVIEMDEYSGEIFAYYKTGRKYEYLFAAQACDIHNQAGKLMVVYVDVESLQRFTCDWNNFFSTILLDDGNTKSRFEQV